MMPSRRSLAVAAVIPLGAVAGAIPPPGPDGVRVPSPPPPSIEPGKPIAPEARPEEDRPIVASRAERRALVASLRPIVACARRAGYSVPDPVPVRAGALLPWRRGEPDAGTQAAFERCAGRLRAGPRLAP
jgi:hypothetical protein